MENFLPQLHIMVNFSGSCLSFQCAMKSLNELNGLMPHASTGHGVGWFGHTGLLSYWNCILSSDATSNSRPAILQRHHRHAEKLQWAYTWLMMMKMIMMNLEFLINELQVGNDFKVEKCNSIFYLRFNFLNMSYFLIDIHCLYTNIVYIQIFSS